MNVILTIIGGIVGRMILVSLGTILGTLNLPPDTITRIVDLVQSLGPVGGPIASLLVLGLAYAWSYWQKHKSGALNP